MKEFLYGRNPVYEALVAGRRNFFQLYLHDGVKEDERMKKILRLCKEKKVPVRRVPKEKLSQLASLPKNTNTQGILLEASEYPYVNLDDILLNAKQKQEAPFVLILDTLQDPQNLGTLIRTAEIIGVHGVVIPTHRAAGVLPSVVNASSGAAEHSLVAQVNLARAIEQLKEENVWVIGLEGGDDAQPVQKVRLDGPIALVVGSEGTGLRRLVRDSCDVLMSLPMRGKTESLNAAVAGSVSLYFAWQARNFNENN
jgi:23S rRNA (guanosine2251-2'-O)-methyltransferase